MTASIHLNRNPNSRRHINLEWKIIMKKKYYWNGWCHWQYIVRSLRIDWRYLTFAKHHTEKPNHIYGFCMKYFFFVFVLNQWSRRDTNKANDRSFLCLWFSTIVTRSLHVCALYGIPLVSVFTTKSAFCSLWIELKVVWEVDTVQYCNTAQNNLFSNLFLLFIALFAIAWEPLL